jgi:hypothetical protein
MKNQKSKSENQNMKNQKSKSENQNIKIKIKKEKNRKSPHSVPKGTKSGCASLKPVRDLSKGNFKI